MQDSGDSFYGENYEIRAQLKAQLERLVMQFREMAEEARALGWPMTHEENVEYLIEEAEALINRREEDTQSNE